MCRTCHIRIVHVQNIYVKIDAVVCLFSVVRSQQQVNSNAKQLAELTELNEGLKSELDVVRGTFTVAGGGASMADKLAEAESLLEQKNREVDGLKVIGAYLKKKKFFRIEFLVWSN